MNFEVVLIGAVMRHSQGIIIAYVVLLDYFEITSTMGTSHLNVLGLNITLLISDIRNTQTTLCLHSSIFIHTSIFIQTIL